jgi:hypothetical protein
MAPICSLEMEVFVLGKPCAEVLRFIRDRFPTMPFDGKGGGFWLEVPDGDGRAPTWMKVAGDGPICTQDHVLEFALPECADPLSAAVLATEHVLPFLARLEERLQVKFLLGSSDLHGHRAAYQVNVSLSRSGHEYYHAMAPLLMTLSCVMGPGGPGRAGYVKAPRMSMHTTRFLGSTPDGAPIAYPRSDHHGSPQRGHLSLEYPRAPGAFALGLGVVALATLAYELAPDRFQMRLVDDAVAAGRRLNELDGDVRARVRTSSGERCMTGLEIQAAFLALAADVVRYRWEVPAWVPEMLARWEAAIEAASADRFSPDSDYLIKKPVLQRIMAQAGLEFGSKACQSAYAACCRLLRRGRDLDALFSRPWRERCPSLLAFRRPDLRQIYERGMRQALLFEAGYRRVGPDNLCDRLLAAMPAGPASRGGVALAPRAERRAKVLEEHAGEQAVWAGWNGVRTAERYIALGAPEASESAWSGRVWEIRGISQALLKPSSSRG